MPVVQADASCICDHLNPSEHTKRIAAGAATSFVITGVLAGIYPSDKVVSNATASAWLQFFLIAGLKPFAGKEIPNSFWAGVLLAVGLTMAWASK